ncbi:MAG: DNA-3-methyladenine glycosylase [Oscillospiraceae bacterium]|nr:DNA-3-methyladenine glycosylase [Oscillospiraceae bacterium]
MRIKRDFYIQPADVLAPLLLGKILCRCINGEVLRRRITETEAYVGAYDTACHAFRGKTPRNSVMYEHGGVAYVYLCYGIHHLLNVVSAQKDVPEAVLIRGVEGYPGPGKLTRALSIDRSLNGADFVTSGELWIEDDGGEPPLYAKTPRIGIDYASDEDRTRLWRFVINNSR